MAFKELSSSEQKIVLECFHATLAFIDSDEFQTRLGITPEDLRHEIELWPAIEDSDEPGNGLLAINNCLNEVCYGFRISPAEWPRWFDVPLEAVTATYEKWLRIRGIRGGIK